MEQMQRISYRIIKDFKMLLNMDIVRLYNKNLIF